MNKKFSMFLFTVLFTLFSTGCLRTYSVTKERIDQDLSKGNRGFLYGSVPADISAEKKERKTTRRVYNVEMELLSPFKSKKQKAAGKKLPSEEGIKTPETSTQQGSGFSGKITAARASRPKETEKKIERYTVQKYDTLQTISKKFFGTTKKWMDIFEFNKETLKSPDRIFPGQVINIPLEPLMEPEENLK